MNSNNHNYYVAVDGCDEWSGKLPQPDNTGKDGPFASLGKAVEVTRSLKNDIGKRIIIREGSYYDVSIELNSEDSGLTIEAMEGETPVLYGGRRITGWKKEIDGEFWYADLPTKFKENWDFRMLVVNGRLCKRSRLPEVGAFHHLTKFNVEWTSTLGGGWERKPTEEELSNVQYMEGDLGQWLDINNAELTIYHKWDESLVGIASHDVENNTLKLSNLCGHPPGSFRCSKYAVWNIREGMKQQGQWYLDRTLGRVVYWPMSGEIMERVEVIVPTVYHILNFVEKVKNITVKGLTFAITNTPLIAAEFAAARMPGALQSLEGMENCNFIGLTIKNTGGHGVKLLGCYSAVTIENCEISYTGAGGILFKNNMNEVEKKEGIKIMVSCMPSESIEDQPDCSIINNHIHHVGMISTSAIALSAFCCNIIHNEVSDTPYSGICYGPYNGIRYGGRYARIEYNIVSRAMQVLNDGAAIYATFADDGIIRGNITRDIQQSDESGSVKHAIYLDECSQGWLVEGNMVINCSHPTLNHMACCNTIRNNVFVCDSSLKMSLIKCKEYKVEKNIIYAKGKIIFNGNPDAITDCGNNLLYSLTDEYEENHVNDKYETYNIEPLKFRDGTIKADPLFVDEANGNYTLKAESPAFKLGIERIDVSKAGKLK
jgi:hypothetical protein